MQAEGFRLDSIQRLLDQPGGAGEQIFNFGRTLLTSFGDDTPSSRHRPSSRSASAARLIPS